MSDFDPEDYTLMNNDQVAIDALRGLLMAKYTVCYWDDNEGRRTYVKNIFADFGDALLCKEMKLSGKSMTHYDVSLFVNPVPSAYMPDFRNVAVMANMEMFI